MNEQVEIDGNPAVEPPAAGLKKEKPANTDYKRYLWQGFAALFLLVVCLGGWSFAKIKGAVIASGVIVVDGKPKTLQHLDGGIVGEILVRNGSKVEAGDVVLRLDPTTMDANRTIVEKRLYEALAHVDRLKAERDVAARIKWASRLVAVAERADVKEIMDGQANLFSARRKSFNGQIGQLKQRILQSEEQIHGLRDLIGSKNTQLELITEELGGLRKLLIKGYVSKTRLLALEREQARLRGEMATHRSDIARTKSAIGETNIQIIQVKKDMEAQILGELRQIDSELSDLTEQFTTASDQRKRVDVTTPVAGIVHDLVVTTVGGVITPGQPMMQIIPVNERLIIEARILTNDIDQVYEGQPATITLSAFNQRTTPQFNGFVTKTSADRLIDQVTGMSYFNVRIEIPDEELKKLGSLTLIPGMPAEAFLQTQDRRVYTYLTKPFSQQLKRTFREE